MDNSKFFNKGISTPIGILIIVLCALIAGGILAWQYLWVPREEAKAPEETTEDETADWTMYKNAKYKFKFKYPKECEICREESDSVVFCSRRGIIQANLKEERDFSCPSPALPCWTLIKQKDPEFLQEQFRILEEVNRNKGITPELRERIKSNFRLLSMGSDGIFFVDSIYNQNLESYGIRLIGYDGTDIEVSNYYYRATFLADNKVISMSASLFPPADKEIYSWADQEYTKYLRGQENILFPLTESLIEGEIKKSPINKVLETYNQMLSTFRFLE